MNVPPYWIPSAWSYIHPMSIIRHLRIPFGVGLFPMYMWDWCVFKGFKGNSMFGIIRTFPLQVISMLLDILCRPLMCIMVLGDFYLNSISTSLVYFVCLVVVQIWWGVKLSLGSLDCLYYAQRRGGLGLINVATHGSILVDKWMMKHLEGSVPCQVLFQ